MAGRTLSIKTNPTQQLSATLNALKTPGLGRITKYSLARTARQIAKNNGGLGAAVQAAKDTAIGITGQVMANRAIQSGSEAYAAANNRNSSNNAEKALAQWNAAINQDVQNPYTEGEPGEKYNSNTTGALGGG